MPSSTHKKIAIIGAGPAGLAAAEALRKKGYRNIQIFEKKGRVGGMAHSKTYLDAAGNKIVYELGSVQPSGSTRLFKLIKDQGLHLGKDFAKNGILRGRAYCVSKKEYVIDFFKYPYISVPLERLPQLLLDAIKLSYWIIKYARLRKAGFNIGKEKSHELAQSFRTWIQKRNLSVLNRTLNLLWSIYLNSGVFEKRGDHAIIYGLKCICVEVFNRPLRYLIGEFAPLTEGYQTLWDRVAKQHNILLNSKIIRVTCGDKVIIETAKAQHTFDNLIIACPPADLVDITNFTDNAKKIFSKICYSPAWKVAFIAENLPANAACTFVDEVENAAAKPQIAFFTPEGQLSDGNWLYSGMLGDHNINDVEECIKHSEDILKKSFNAKSIKWIDRAYWPRYNSHFKCEDIKNGIYEQFEKLQGEHNTYYVGEILAGAGHGMNIDYSYHLVKRFF